MDWIDTLEITESKLMELRGAVEELNQKLNRLFYSFVNGVPDILAVLNKDMRHLTVSEEWLNRLGMRREDVIGKSLQQVIPEFPQNWKTLEKKCQPGSMQLKMTGPVKKANGEEFLAHWILWPWFEETGEMGGVIIQKGSPPEPGETGAGADTAGLLN